MPSRKKAKGKARKAAKEAKAKAKDEESWAVVNVATRQRREEWLEAKLQQLRISAPSPTTMCRHGLAQLSAGEEKICLEFINAFINALFSRATIAEGFSAAQEATKEYADVYYFSMLDAIVSMVLANGTQRILDGRNDIAQQYAMLSCYFEEFNAVTLHKTKAILSWAKVVELESADDHTLVSYYRKRISCSCLDEKYKEVKSMTRMGMCFNLNCSRAGRKVERSKMFSCSRCDTSNYCSVECQKAVWEIHKQDCEAFVEVKAAFNASQT